MHSQTWYWENEIRLLRSSEFIPRKDLPMRSGEESRRVSEDP